MKEIQLEVDSKKLSMKLPEPLSGFQSCFVFSAHKCGSTLLNRMTAELCKVSGIPVLDFPSAYFRAGIRIDSVENAECVKEFLKSEGYVYLGSRTFWCKELGFDFSGVKKVLLVRDPRDAIISWYFSDKSSHDIPKSQKGFTALRDKLQETSEVNSEIDYLRSRARLLAKLCSRYKEILEDENTVVYRYEDVIFRKRPWLQDINSYFNLGVSDAEVNRIADSFDAIPEKEDPQNFIRQVNPGNHIKHFSEDTIADLHGILEEFIQIFGYDKIQRFNEQLGNLEQGQKT